MKKIVVLLGLFFVGNVYAQVPQKICKNNTPCLETVPSDVLKKNLPEHTYFLPIPQGLEKDTTPRTFRFTLDNSSEIPMQYTYKNVMAGKAIGNFGSFKVVIKPLEPANYAANYRP